MRFLKIPPVKYTLIALAAVLWLAGLIDQLDSLELTARYLAISAVIAAVLTV